MSQPFCKLRRAALVMAAFGASMSIASAASAAGTLNFTLTGAQFNAYDDGNPGETVSGTFSLDIVNSAITSLSLTATGGDSLTYGLANVNGLTVTGDNTTSQYEIQLQEANSGEPFYLDFQTTAPASVLVSSINGYMSNLYDLNGSYSGLTSPGTLAVVSVPEPSSWALMLVGIGIFGGLIRRSRREMAFA